MKKTQKSFKKKALLSSLSMLMVATVAVGSATFAWFTSSTTATASGLNVKTIQASELVISDFTKSWGTTVDYEIADKVLMPASTSDGSNWWTANAETKTSYAKKSTDVFTAADAPTFNTPASSSYAYADQLNVMNSGEADVENVTITWTIPNFSNSNYLRVALVPADATGNFVYESGKSFVNYVYDKDGVAYDAASGASTTTSITPATTCSVNVGTLSKDEAAYFNLYIWFEGQDEQCFDGNAGQIIPDIEFSVTGSTVDQT